MIPSFNEHGYLPPGVHPATIEEVDARFGRQSEIRRHQMESVRWMVEIANRAGIRRIILNGSFVTDIMEPNDVDCVLLIRAADVEDTAAIGELRAGLPFLDISLVGRRQFQDLAERFFAADRWLQPKGMIEVIE